MTGIRKIKLSLLAKEVRGNVDVDSCPALSINQTDEPQIVEQSERGYNIVDGYHRTGGQINWCEANDVDLDDAEIAVVVCDDATLIADAAEPGRKQQAAIDAIYRLAGVR